MYPCCYQLIILNLLKEDKYSDVKYGIKLGYKNISFNGKFYTFPYFLTFLLKRFYVEEKVGKKSFNEILIDKEKNPSNYEGVIIGF